MLGVLGWLLAAIIRKKLQLDASHYTLLQVLTVTLFEKIPASASLSGLQAHSPGKHAMQPTESIHGLTRQQ